jgi:hypothetical protein
MQNKNVWAWVSGAALSVALAIGTTVSAQAAPIVESAPTIAVTQSAATEGGAASSVAVRSDFCSLMPGLCGGPGAASDYDIPQFPIKLPPYGGICTQTDEKACHQECVDGGFLGCGTAPGNAEICYWTPLGRSCSDTGVPAPNCEAGCTDEEYDQAVRDAQNAKRGKAPKSQPAGSVKVPCFSDPEWCAKIGAG